MWTNNSSGYLRLRETTRARPALCELKKRCHDRLYLREAGSLVARRSEFVSMGRFSCGRNCTSVRPDEEFQRPPYAVSMRRDRSRFGTAAGPIAAYLALSGSWVKALALIGRGLLAIGTIYNILYPYLVGNRLRLHTVPTFFAILGGISLFGPAGLILGPLALAIMIGLLQVWWSRIDKGRTAEESAEPDSHSVSPSEAMQTNSAASQG